MGKTACDPELPDTTGCFRLS